LPRRFDVIDRHPLPAAGDQVSSFIEGALQLTVRNACRRSTDANIRITSDTTLRITLSLALVGALVPPAMAQGALERILLACKPKHAEMEMWDGEELDKRPLDYRLPDEVFIEIDLASRVIKSGVPWVRELILANARSELFAAVAKGPPQATMLINRITGEMTVTLGEAGCAGQRTCSGSREFQTWTCERVTQKF
jgi:hypothetical protein